VFENADEDRETESDVEDEFEAEGAGASEVDERWEIPSWSSS
jgi:hypothetical protein